MQRADELERFKAEINLVEYAQARGYEIDRRESSRASTVMRSDQDKIIVATGGDGHGVYFSVTDDRDNGSIIDFVQRRQGLNLGQVRKELRPWIGGGRPAAQVQRRPEAERPAKPSPSSASRQRVLAAWIRTNDQPPGGHPYLTEKRALEPFTLSDARFSGMVHMDERGNAVFPHYDAQGLTGFELKNDGFTGFSAGGTKALWHSANIQHAPRVVVVESAIDAMSHAQLSGDQDAAYVSTGGAMSEAQREQVRVLLADAVGRGAVVVLATDADPAGDKLADQVRALAPTFAQVERQRPTMGKDWNDQVHEVARQVQRERHRDHGMSR